MIRRPEPAGSAAVIARCKQVLRTTAAAMALLGLAACAVGPRPPAPLPAPPQPASRPGPWGTTYAVYDPAIFGPERPLAELISAYRLRLTDGKLKNARLLLNKSQRRLELWVGRRMVKAYRVQLGENPVGRKTRQGDSRTPEGEYFICDRQPSTYYRSLWISYPNLDDARVGLEFGLITRKQFEEITTALKKGICPPQDTRLGGLLLLHGQLPEHTEELARGHRSRPSTPRPGFEVGDADPSKVREFHDWTDGCAGMFNPDIRELYQFIPQGTRLTIVANGMITPPALPSPHRK
jgi:hypothetical protein